jgi:putative membrane protein
MMHGWMNWPDWQAGWSTGGMMFTMAVHLLWYLFVIALAALVALAIMRRTGTGRASATDILKARYARGELSKADFDRMRQELAG